MAEVTITGNVVSDPELNYTQTGLAVCSFRIARAERYRTSSGEWKDGETLFITVTCWRDLAENTAASLVKGARIVVQGKIRNRTWEDTRYQDASGDSIQRIVTEIQADDISASVRTAQLVIKKTERTTTPADDSEPPF
jgi:single-strand DNA-binding protein